MRRETALRSATRIWLFHRSVCILSKALHETAAILSRRDELPSNTLLDHTIAQTIAVLKQESSGAYRPRCGLSDGSSVPGGLLDFRGERRLPLLIVPDLHARPDFFRTLMLFSLPERYLPPDSTGAMVCELLARSQLRIVCVGDGLHSEAPGYGRWRQALRDYAAGIADGDAMREEMAAGLSLMLMVMRLKCLYPAHFHFLKGNHENILNAEGGGNHGFVKFAAEGAMTAAFMRTYYGESLTAQYARFERLLPVCAVFPQCIVSHAEPETAYSREELIQAPVRPDVTEGLTWTDNGAAQYAGVRRMLRDFLPDAPCARYFGGHRPVHSRYELRDEGAFVQIHNPLEWRAAVVSADGAFDEERDILDITVS